MSGEKEHDSLVLACQCLNILFYKVPAVCVEEGRDINTNNNGHWWEAELRDKNIPIKWDEEKGEFIPSSLSLS